MLTYEIRRQNGISLYDGLYRAIRDDILSGKIAPGERLPSKRGLAEHLGLSRVTVETAYAQLAAEGYVCARERVGYFAEKIDRMPQGTAQRSSAAEPSPVLRYDFTRSGADLSHFPYSVLAHLLRRVIAEERERLLSPTDGRGTPEMREAIAGYLSRMRGMNVSPEQIIVGAGTEYLYQLLVQLLGRDSLYAVEEPGYPKTRSILRACGGRTLPIGMDESGVSPSLLRESGVNVLHISPSHHYPTGIVTAAGRRQEILAWAAKANGYILEDDYDSEFRFVGRPIPTLFSADKNGRVIYLNTFSRTIAPSFRISYMVLPEPLNSRYRSALGFYSSTVPALDQLTLGRFIADGYFEKHISRMRKRYRSLRDSLLREIEKSPLRDRTAISEEDAGLHFLMRVDTPLSDEALTCRAAEMGIGISCLSRFYEEGARARQGIIVMNYSGLRQEDIPEAVKGLTECLL